MQRENSAARTIVLTGAAGLLGRAIAEALVGAGHRLLLTDRGVDDLEAAANQLGGGKGAVAICATDLTSAEAPAKIEAAAAKAFGPVDMLINNAAFTAFAAWAEADQPNAWELETELVRTFFEINFIAQQALVRQFVPGMIERRWGRVVNLSCSYDTMQRLYPYGATKAALEAFTSAMEKQLAGTGVTAHTLNPGGPVFHPAHYAAHPNLTWVQPDIVNAPLLWLASDDSNGIPGRRWIGTRWLEGMEPMEALGRAAGPMNFLGFGAFALR
ncbi:SDR family oxidoreductase [Novosphingobium flavum]|uniref:SDR family oxidoreductase n=1 Tax=Novosphingobium flavum TaxID=1778672 RepID=A0A7X1FV68_9SPHN|nr:SDR family oxidoreductase [Novosphingobium flavum]MBC2667007.1 SDR family oxidoreductase [Novosphingobium flavum]